MASNKEQIDLGQLILQSDMEALYIKNVQIEEESNEHGTMVIRFLSGKKLQSADVLRYQGSKLRLVTTDGETVFAGECVNINLIKENEYAEIEVVARTTSIQTDKQEKSNTFQGAGKTLNSILAVGIGKSALIQLDRDVTIDEMLSQEKETDWSFGRRIANQYQKQFFVNSKATGCQIHIGEVPFQKKEVGTILHKAVSRDIDKVRSMQGNKCPGNNSPAASVFEYEETTLTISDLTLGVGYAIEYQGRMQIVTRSRITCVQGVLQNEITIVHEEGLKPSVNQSMGSMNRSSILTGTVLEVDGTNVKVDFHSPNDEPRWIPYAHAVSNYLYSMPDEGDTVFVYYETGASDKIVCLGSKHVKESPDFANYQDKMFTANNRMIKFGDKSVNLVGNRSELDGYDDKQAKIIFNDETGIEIQSTNDILLETTDGGQISFQAVKEDFPGMDELRQKFERMYGEGNDKYEADGGKADFDAMAYLQGKEWDRLKQNIKDNLMAPLQIVGTLQELAGRIGGSDETETEAMEEAAPEYTDGVIDIFALNNLVLEVGTTTISISNGIIQIKTGTYMQLGTDRSVTYEHLEDANYTWRDMALDVAQLALDIVGALPIPGVSTVANLANAGISLARGDYVGAAISAGTAALSLIPGANTAVAAGKAAVTAATKASKVVKAVSAVAKAVKALKTGAESANMLLTTGMAVYDVGKAVADGSFDWNDPDCRQDVFSILQGAHSTGQMASSRKKKGDGADANSNDTHKIKDTEKDTNNPAETNKPKLNENSDNRCKNGEPIDMVTGSYLVEQCDFIINDVAGIFAVERTYESLLSKKDSPIGRGWTLSLFSRAYIYDDRVEVVLPDNHTETFLKTAQGFRNRRGGTKRMTLHMQENGYLLTEARTGITRFYDADGRLLIIADENGNKTIYHYIGDTLQRISFASGQYLDFLWEDNKLISMEDCLGRKVVYHYEGDFLTAVEMVTGGMEAYAYDAEGHITDITNANGETYVHNEYDASGRVTLQTLSNGQEYILLYADDDRTNTYLVPANGKEIRYIYNKDRQLIRTEYQDGTCEETAYDCWENRIWEKDRNGNETHRIYDEYGHLLEEKKPDGLTISYEYDPQGNCIHMADNAGRESWYEYDRNGNLIKETEQIDAFTQREIFYEYDKHGRVTAFIDSNGNRESFHYGQKFWKYTTFITAGGTHYEHGLDRAGRRVTTKDSDGISSYAYNNFDILCMETDPLGNTTKYLYDRVLDMTGVVQPKHFHPASNDEKRETYTYDALHNRLSRTDAEGAVFAMLRDGEGNIIKEINPNAYDSNTKDGEGIAFSFDANDHNELIYYPDGGVERRWHDARGNLVGICRPEQYDAATDSGKGYSYEYDCMNRLIQITAPDGTVQRRYVYDLHGNIIKIIDARGMATGESDEKRIGELYAYNYLGWLTERRIPMCEEKGEVRYQLTQYQYDKTGNLRKEQRYCDYQTKDSADGVVHTISYAYDADSRLISVSDCTGAVMEFQYDAQGRRIYERQKMNDSQSRVLRYRYDAAGRLTELNRSADQDGCGRSSVSVRFEYDPNGNNIRTLLPTGAEIHREYDAADRLIMECHIDKNSGIDNTTHFAYDKAGNLVCITDNQGRKTEIEYDLMNREIRRTEKDGSVTRQFYDKNGQLIKTIRPKEYDRAGDNGSGVQYTYDAQGRILTVIRADGSIQESNVYDSEGQLIATTDGTGAGADFHYDLGGRRTRIETKGNATQQYEYDALGNITGVVDGVGNRTEYVLDKWGRITEIKQADGSSERYGYDYAGNITSSTDGEGNTTTYTYNGINQLAAITDPMGQQESYAYDEEERLCRKEDRNGTVTKYSYNMYGNLLTRKARKSEETEELSEVYEYTQEGLLKSALSQGMRYSYTYDVMDRLMRKMASGRTLLALDYDRNGNLLTQTDVTGKVTEYRYDVTDRLSEVWDNGRKIAGYEYHGDGTIKRLQCGSLYTEYDYDIDRNLTGLRTMLGDEVIVDNHYRYDGNGNRLEKQHKYGTTRYTYDSMNRLAKVEYPDRKEELFYDKAGNRTRRVMNGMEELYRYDKRNRLTEYTKGGAMHQFSYDNAGNLIQDDRAKYEYDAFNRNNKVETFNGNIQINHYDAEGLRHEMEENGRLVSFIFRGTEVVTEETQEDRIRYIRTNELLASDAESARTYYHYASDEIGNITHVVNDTNVINHYEYDVWGNLTVCEETIENRIKYNGQQFDPISQQYYLRARYYNPVIGRFTQEDTYRGDGLNLYAYCRNNPVFYIDPSGHYVCPKGVKRIVNEIKKGTSNSDDRSRLLAHLQEKREQGQSLTRREKRAEKQLAGDSGKKSGINTEVIMPSKPHTNGTQGHWETILDEVDIMKSSGDYSKIYVNKGLSNEIPGAKPNRRPDIMGVRKDGLIDQVEVPSKTDDPLALRNRMKDNQRILGGRAGNIKIRSIKQ